MSNQELWGTPPKKKPISGAYERNEFTAAGQFGPREAGSTFAGTIQAGTVFLPAAAAIEYLADSSMPTGMAFGASWFSAALSYVVLKVIGNMLRHHGASMFRDFGAWLWEIITGWFGVVWPDLPGLPDKEKPGLIERLFGWKRPRRRIIRRRRKRII